LEVEVNTKSYGVQQNIGLILVFSETRMCEIHEIVEGVLMKGPIEIEQYSNFMNIKLIRDNLTIK
jgi:hypothetical protein